MRISWITEDPIQPTVTYATSPGLSNAISAIGTSSSYKFRAYSSGNIHNVVIGPLDPSTTYYYLCGPSNSTLYNFSTPPAYFPIKFAVSGTTLQHYKMIKFDTNFSIFKLVLLEEDHKFQMQVILDKQDGLKRRLNTYQNQTMMYSFYQGTCHMQIITSHYGIRLVDLWSH